MSGIFGGGGTTVNMPAPAAPIPPPQLPDPSNPAALDAARTAAAARAGRSSTILTNASNRGTIAAGGSPGVGTAPYSGKTLGG